MDRAPARISYTVEGLRQLIGTFVVGIVLGAVVMLFAGTYRPAPRDTVDRISPTVIDLWLYARDWVCTNTYAGNERIAHTCYSPSLAAQATISYRMDGTNPVIVLMPLLGPIPTPQPLVTPQPYPTPWYRPTATAPTPNPRGGI